MFTFYADYAIDLAIDVAAIFVMAYALYFRRHRRADLLLGYVTLNIGLFVAMSVLITVRVDIALGFGLFAILSIIRLRSSTVTQQEVAYYFVALVLGLVNGMNLPDRPLVVLVNVLLLVTMFVVDSKPLRERTRRVEITLDVVHADDAALVADLERRLGGRVMHHQVDEVDYVRDIMVVDVRYRDRLGHHRAEPRQAAAGGEAVSTRAPDSTPGTATWGIPTPAERAVAAAAATIDPIGLDELLGLAELQTRVDRKYFVPAALFRQLIAELSEELRVLEIGGRRTFGYESVYFDTPQLTTYRAHLQRRRQRFKARTRTYTDSGLCMFEVKLTGARGETVKQRVPHPVEDSAELTDGARAHLRTALGAGLPPGPAARDAADAGHHVPAHHVRLPHR